MTGWNGEPWQQVDYERYWDPFDAKFEFRPSTHPEKWPTITEPTPSVTFDLGPVFSREDGFAPDQNYINRAVLDAFIEALPDPETRLVALDWQHQSYWLWPHMVAGSVEPWRAEPFPNGDYYIWLTEDLSSGTFGHPWEQTLCVFGEPMLRTLVPRLDTWLDIKRDRR